MIKYTCGCECTSEKVPELCPIHDSVKVDPAMIDNRWVCDTKAPMLGGALPDRYADLAGESLFGEIKMDASDFQPIPSGDQLDITGLMETMETQILGVSVAGPGSATEIIELPKSDPDELKNLLKKAQRCMALAQKVWPPSSFSPDCSGNEITVFQEQKASEMMEWSEECLAETEKYFPMQEIITCPDCGWSNAVKNVTVTLEDQQWQVLHPIKSVHDPMRCETLNALVPIFTCKSCGFSYTNWIGADIRDFKTREFRAQKTY